MKSRSLLRSLPFAVPALVLIGIALAFVRTGQGLWHEDFQIAVSVETGEWTRTCVRSVGYWRTHSSCSTNPHRDLAWNGIGEDTPFFETQETWCSALWETEQKDPYWRLARQYIAARLNQANGAERPPVMDAALSQAAAWLQAHEPGSISEDDPDYQQSIELKNLLEDFNTGRHGPFRCDDNERIEGDYVDRDSGDERNPGNHQDGETNTESTEPDTEDQPIVTPVATPTETDDSSGDGGPEDSEQGDDTPPPDDSTATDDGANEPELTEEPDGEGDSEATPAPGEGATEDSPDEPPVDEGSGESGN